MIIQSCKTSNNFMFFCPDIETFETENKSYKLPPIPIIQKHTTETKIVTNHSKTLPSLFRYEGPNVLREIGHNSFEDLLCILLKQSWKSQKKNAAVKMILRILRFLRNQLACKMIRFFLVQLQKLVWIFRMIQKTILMFRVNIEWFSSIK